MGSVGTVYYEQQCDLYRIVLMNGKSCTLTAQSFEYLCRAQERQVVVDGYVSDREVDNRTVEIDSAGPKELSQ